jgi:hypothetical protein
MKRIEPKQNAIQIQDEYVARVMAAKARWAHRKCGGQSHRTIGSARRVMAAKLSQWQYNKEQIRQAIQDANDIVALEIAAVDSED